MKQSEFKKIIKEAVREAIQEELKDILLEAIRSSKNIVKENNSFDTNFIPTPIPNSHTISKTPNKAVIDSILGDMKSGKAKFTSEDLGYRPPPVNTMVEGSRLPEGEVGLDQIMGLINK